MKICCVFNIAPSYREAIYRLMDSELDVDFLFGENATGGIAVMDPRVLKGFRGYLRNIYKKSGKLVWQRGWRKAFSRRYDAYILTGNPGIRSNWVIAVIARLTGRKVYLWSHGLHGDESPMSLRKNMLYFRLASHILLYGERGRELMSARGIPCDKMTVIYNSLDYDRQVGIRNHMGDSAFIRNYFGNDLPLACYVGRLIPSKKLDLLLDAMSHASCNLILVGDGPQREMLEQKAEQPGLTDRVWFYGESYDEQLTGTVLYYSAVCVSPGSVGLTAMHSLTFGTPVVTHDNILSQLPESEAVADGITGAFFHEGDPRDLAAKMQYFLDLSFDPPARQNLRNECYKIIMQKFNPHAQIAIMKRVFGMDFVE